MRSLAIAFTNFAVKLRKREGVPVPAVFQQEAGAQVGKGAGRHLILQLPWGKAGAGGNPGVVLDAAGAAKPWLRLHL